MTDDVKDAVQADNSLKPPFALEAFGDLNTDVRQSVARINASPFVPNKTSVRGFIFDVATGRLDEVA